MFNHHLKCAFCDREFHDFGPLGDHVSNEHPDVVNAAQRLVESLENQEKEKENMLPPAGGTTSGGAGAGRRPRTGIPFLTFDMLSTSTKEAKILDIKVETENRFGPSVVLKLALEGKMVLWTVRIKNNPNYSLLTEHFGHDENEFVGQKILLAMEKDDFSEQYFPRVSFPTNNEPEAKTKRR